MRKETLITTLILALLVAPVSAKIYPPSNGAKVYLGYNNSTYTDLPTDHAYFNDIRRVDNVWYINGEELPIIPALSTEEAAIIGVIFAIVVLAVSVGLIMSKRREEE